MEELIMTYEENLNNCKKSYPFVYWLEDYNEGLNGYSEENCNKVESIFDDLICSLIKLGEKTSIAERVILFEMTVKSLNIIREVEPKLIETGEREEFCDLFDEIAIAAEINPKEYGSGDGIATEWRTW